ncbi:hypothetical protein ACFXPJ_00540 [Streptomyces goshikiensis]
MPRAIPTAAAGSPTETPTPKALAMTWIRSGVSMLGRPRRTKEKIPAYLSPETMNRQR